MRDRLIAIVFGVVVLAVVGGGLWLVTNRVGVDPQAEAEAAVDAYLQAWEAGDTATMRTLVTDPPAAFDDLHAQLREALEPTSFGVQRQEVVLQGSQADTDLTVRVGLPDADDAVWTSHLTAQRLEGEWRVLWDPSVIHPELRASSTWDVIEEPAGRAEIRAHDGTALTAPGELVSVGVEPRRIEDEQELLGDLAGLLPEAGEPLVELLARDDLHDDWYYPLVTLRPDRWADVERDVMALPGIVVRTEEARVGSDDGFALHTLGRVGPADEERAAELGVAPGEPVGQYGLEAVFEDRLTGTPALDVVIRDADGEVTTTVHHYQGDPPEPVTTTLDADVQRAVENALVGVSDPTGVVVIDASSGAIRGVASRPLAGFNRALAGRYPPGSTFKVVTAAAAMTAGVQPDDPVPCPGEVVLGGLRLRNAHDLALGEITLARAFTVSCNTAFASLAADLDDGALDEAAASFGFGVDYGLPLDTFGGSFPAPADLAERAAAAIGQARVEASPLHMASVAAAVASGAWRPPYLLADDGPGEPSPLPPQLTSDLTTMMRAVVAEGTATAAQVPGDPPVAGKTGSAEFGTGDPKPTHAWFIGFRGDLAFAVLVEGGGEGGSVAAPIAARVLRELDALSG